MNIKTGFDKNYSKWFLKDVLRAVKTYRMIEENETICVALSGGKDSITLLFILHYLSQFSHLHFTLSAAHIKIGDYDTAILKELCETLNVPYLEESLVFERIPP